jgi:hypothetical protein
VAFLHVFPLGETFLSLSFMKRTIAHNSLIMVILHFIFFFFSFGGIFLVMKDYILIHEPQVARLQLRQKNNNKFLVVLVRECVC